MEKQKCPQVRFNSFYDEWKKQKLFDVALYKNGKSHESEIVEKGKYVVVNSKFVSTNGSVKKYCLNQIEPLHNGDIAFVLSDVPNGRALSKTFLIDKDDLYTLNQRIAAISPRENCDSAFLHRRLDRHEYFLKFDDGVGQTNLSLRDMEEFISFYPSRAEQIEIGIFFQNLDQSIALHEKKLIQTQNFKKAMLEKMFPKQGSLCPEIRLKGFSGDWNIEVIGDVLQEVFRPINLDKETKYRLVTVKRRNGGIAERAILKGKDILVKSQFEVKAGDYIISKRQVVHGATGLVPPELDGSVVSNEYLVGQGTDKLNIGFFALLSTLPEMYQKFFLSSYGVDIEKLFFDVNDWKKREVLLPPLEEQVQISAFFKQVDKTLNLQQQQLQTLKNLKQALLEKMFV
ncbi:restriction endonuclease subunit S [Acinetobacter johnsonii]|uniref:restriction endonuclease subunit S n=1 Tax=Acinetobacter johnsonii TaxID=40214 RepID=UPI0011E67ADE|nr:restriction endonuclease subunit S [Acinetobacter johnsonii]MDH0711241.1 restriction endonuclease subunit S [Acinetobacter johnsonii]QEK36611.1 restriction endonuclease subunit S [Acinetobacter johnsonii]